MIRVADDRAVVVCSYHHLLLDGWNRQLVQQELTALNKAVQVRFDELGTSARLECVELSLRPTGFTVVAGHTAALSWSADRLRGNATRANLLGARNS